MLLFTLSFELSESHLLCGWSETVSCSVLKNKLKNKITLGNKNKQNNL